MSDISQARSNGTGLDLAVLLDRARQAVRSDTVNAANRLNLGVGMLVAGQWKAASDQLGIAAEMAPEHAVKVALYRKLIEAEQQRERIWSGTESPICAGAAQEWLVMLVEALRAWAGSNIAAASELRARAMDLAPASQGTMTDGTHFQWIADSDPRLGPVIELMLDGQYRWSAFNELRRLRFQPPRDLTDLIWMPVIVDWADGHTTHAYTPARYPVSEQGVTDDHRLARRTDFIDVGHDLYRVIGQKMWCTDNSDISLLDCRDLTFAE